MKKYSKGHVGSLYYSHKVKSGDTWRMTQLLGHICLKELTPIIKFTEISLFHAKLRLISWFLTGCFIKGHYHPFEPVLVQTNHYPFFFSIRLSTIKPLMLD
jgi:hypothetical protein